MLEWLVIIVGDIHGDWAKFNILINEFEQKNPDKKLLIICVGDFGFWPNITHWTVTVLSHGMEKKKKIPNLHPKDGIKKKDSTIILFIDGNHEDHWELAKLKDFEIGKNIFYQPRGSTYRLADGRNILFMGGAHSIDKLSRTVGHTWFPEETINTKDMYDLPDEKIDIIVSHTCPLDWLHEMLRHDTRKATDPSNEALSQLLRIYQPGLWFFGHWHRYAEGMWRGQTKWYALNTCSLANKTGWWMKLPK